MQNYHTILLVLTEKETGKSWVHGFFKPADAGLYKWKTEDQNPNINITVYVLDHLNHENEPIYVQLTSKAQLSSLYGRFANVHQ